MSGEVIVKPDKNVFLAYCVSAVILDFYGGDMGDPISLKTIENFNHFKNKIQPKGKVDLSYIGISSLILSEAPGLTKKQNLNLPRTMKSVVRRHKDHSKLIKYFYEHSNFESFYNSILPEYQTLCDKFREKINGIHPNLNKELNEIFKLETPFSNDVIIPIPLESYKEGFGFSIGDTAYQIIGPPFDSSNIGCVIHEALHPRVNRAVMEPLHDEISKRKVYLNQFSKPDHFFPYSSNWPNCFEEHFVRALQIALFEISGLKKYMSITDELEGDELLSRCIDYAFNNFKSGKGDMKGIPPKMLQRWVIGGKLKHNKSWGFRFMDDFYSEIKKHFKSGKGDMKEATLEILQRLDIKYGSDSTVKGLVT